MLYETMTLLNGLRRTDNNLTEFHLLFEFWWMRLRHYAQSIVFPKRTE